MKQKMIKVKERIDTVIITVDDFNIPVSAINKTTREKISKNIKEVSNTIKYQNVVHVLEESIPKCRIHICI